MNRQIPEYLEAEWQTAKDEYKVKTTTYITITKFEYEKLQLENLQLEEKCEMYERQRNRWKKRSNKLAKKCDKNRLVLDEIREYIKEHSIYFATKEKIGNYFANCSCDELLQILDKVGKE